MCSSATVIITSALSFRARIVRLIWTLAAPLRVAMEEPVSMATTTSPVSVQRATRQTMTVCQMKMSVNRVAVIQLHLFCVL